MPEAVRIAADGWTSFSDQALDVLVAEAMQHNRDLARALARIDEARAALALSGADRLPSVVTRDALQSTIALQVVQAYAQL